MSKAETDEKWNQDAPEVVKKFYPGGFFRNDRDGRPVFYEPLGQVDFWGLLHSVKPEQIMTYKTNHCEQAKALCKEQEEKLNMKLEKYSTLVLDAEGGGRKHLWKPGLDLFKSLVQMYDVKYPDLRERILVINTPVIFPILFSLLTPFLKQSTKDKIKVLGTDWKSKLQIYIDPDNLPEHYGGNCRDEDENPKCEKYICFGGEVPTSYYVSENINQDEFQSSVIKAGKKFTITHKVNNINSKLTYQFVTSDFDIKFSVILELESGEEEVIVPESKKQSHILMEDGEIICEKTGNYVFIFDNCYSWIRDKELFYLIKSTDDIDENGGNKSNMVVDDLSNDLKNTELSEN